MNASPSHPQQPSGRRPFALPARLRGLGGRTSRSTRPVHDDAPVSGSKVLGQMVVLSIGVTAVVAVCGTALLTALAAVAWLAL